MISFLVLVCVGVVASVCVAANIPFSRAIVDLAKFLGLVAALVVVAAGILVLGTYMAEHLP